MDQPGSGDCSGFGLGFGSAGYNSGSGFGSGSHDSGSCSGSGSGSDLSYNALRTEFSHARQLVSRTKPTCFTKVIFIINAVNSL